MKSIKKGLIFTLSLALIVGLPVSFASAEGGRFFVKSTSSFWQNTIGARNTFKDGFTADLSDLQFGLLRLFRVDIEAVPVLHILPAMPQLQRGELDESVEPSPSVDPSTEPSEESPTPTPSPTPSATPKAKVLKSKKGNIIRYLPSDQTPWGIETIYNNDSLAATSGGVNINVAVLDTGANISHPDLKNRIIECKDFTNFRQAIVDNQCEDKHGHGTHVAGIIAADGGSDHLGIYGVAPATNLWVYKVCDATGSCYADDIAMGLKTAADNSAQIVNMSFGTDEDIPLITDAVNYAIAHGVLLVAASGNDGPGVDSIDYPGAYGSVIAVGALNPSYKITNWSSRGNNLISDPDVINDRDIEFAAPGENIESTWKGGSYAVLSGTSMASPFVAGLAAKFWQINAEHPAQATRDFLHSLAQDLLPTGEDNDSGLGLPQIK